MAMDALLFFSVLLVMMAFRGCVGGSKCGDKHNKTTIILHYNLLPRVNVSDGYTQYF